MATYLEIAAPSACFMFSLYKYLFAILAVSHLDLSVGTLATVPYHCFILTFQLNSYFIYMHNHI